MTSGPICVDVLLPQSAVKFAFTDYGTADHSSSTSTHLVKFTFTDSGTADRGSSTFAQLINFT